MSRETYELSGFCILETILHKHTHTHKDTASCISSIGVTDIGYEGDDISPAQPICDIKEAIGV
jgi:hypothetical protein